MADSVFKASYSVTTLLGAINQFHALGDLDFSYLDYLPYTLNTKHSKQTVNSSGRMVTRAGNAILECRQADRPTVYPTLKYMRMGIRGAYNLDDGIRCQPYKPKATNMDVHQPIPFRIVPVSQDLSSTERALYRMRTRETIGTEEYYCYWLKLMTFPDNKLLITQVTPENVESPYLLDASDLNPIPVQLDTSDVEGDNNRVIVSLRAQGIITGEEVNEVVSVLFGGDLRYAKISEFGFCSGVDKVVEGDNNGVAIPGGYTEAIFVHLASHKCTLGTDLSNVNSRYTAVCKYESDSMLLV